MTHNGYFTDYPDDEELPERDIAVKDAVDPDEETTEEMAHRKMVFERMVIEHIKDQFSEKIAAIAEYYVTNTDGEGFWNDPIIYQDDWSDELAEQVAERAGVTIKDTDLAVDEEYVVQEAGIE